jgi:spore coat polysaccharide biosynthesis predicted glycosyltransferase SpsG
MAFMKVSILTKASRGYGYGHLRRSNILSDFLRSDGISSQVIDITSGCPEEVNSDVLVVDARELKNDGLKRLLRLGKPIISFDDTETFKPYSVSIMSLPYLNLSGPSPNYEGMNFLILDPSILEVKPLEVRPLEVKPHEFDILITFGGEDPNSLTEIVLSKFADVGEFKDFSICVVIGSLFKGKEFLKEKARELGVFVIEPERPMDVIEAISKSRLVLTSFGITVYESLVLGKRVILLNNSEYHELIFRKSGLDGWVRSLGVYNEFDVYKFLNLVREVLGSGGKAKALEINPIENLRRIEKIIFMVYESCSYKGYFCLPNHDVICTYRDGFCSKFFCRDCGREIIFGFDVPRNT